MKSMKKYNNNDTAQERFWNHYFFNLIIRFFYTCFFIIKVYVILFLLFPFEFYDFFHCFHCFHFLFLVFYVFFSIFFLCLFFLFFISRFFSISWICSRFFILYIIFSSDVLFFTMILNFPFHLLIFFIFFHFAI